MDYRSKEKKEKEKLAFGKRVRLGASRRGNFPFPKRSLPFGTVIAISNNSLLSLS